MHRNRGKFQISSFLSLKRSISFSIKLFFIYIAQGINFLNVAADLSTKIEPNRQTNFRDRYFSIPPFQKGGGGEQIVDLWETG